MKSNESLPLFDFTIPPYDPLELAQVLIKELNTNPLLCIAAPQIGLPYRVFVLAAEIPYVCFNPRVVAELAPEQIMEEICYGYPGMSFKKIRAGKIRVRFVTPTGNISTQIFSGMSARYFLQGMDHITGVNFLSDQSRIVRDRTKKRLQKNAV